MGKELRRFFRVSDLKNPSTRIGVCPSYAGRRLDSENITCYPNSIYIKYIEHNDTLYED
jgi:hypothetical protein